MATIPYVPSNPQGIAYASEQNALIDQVNTNTGQLDTLTAKPFGHAGITAGFVSIIGGVYPPLVAQDLRHGMTFTDGLVVPKDGLYEITAKSYYTGGAAYDAEMAVSVSNTANAPSESASGFGHMRKETAADYSGYLTVKRPLVAGDVLRLWMNSPNDTYGTTGYDGSYIEARWIDD